MVVTWPIGMHMVELAGDLIIMRLSGPFTLSDMKDFYALAEELTKQGPVYILADMDRGSGIQIEARRYSVDHGPRLKISATAVYGFNLVTRTMLTLVSRATALRNRSESKVAFFNTEAQARAFLQRVRERSAQAP